LPHYRLLESIKDNSYSHARTKNTKALTRVQALIRGHGFRGSTLLPKQLISCSDYSGSSFSHNAGRTATTYLNSDLFYRSQDCSARSSGVVFGRSLPGIFQPAGISVFSNNPD